jgi:hypothetical protein
LALPFIIRGRVSGVYLTLGVGSRLLIVVMPHKLLRGWISNGKDQNYQA